MVTVIKNVHIFDGRRDCGIGEVIFAEGRIQSSADSVDTEIDGQGKFLLPGLIDSHVHTYKYLEFLTKATSYGVTTLLEMGNRSREVADLNKSHRELANVLTCYSISAAPTSDVVNRMHYSPDVVMRNADDGRNFVRRMVDWGANYIKIIMEEPQVPFPEEIGQAICSETHKFGKKVIAHTTTIESMRQCLKFGLDVMTHMPMNAEMPDEIVKEVKNQGITLIPTIAMMERSAAVVKKKFPQAPVSREISINNLRKFLNAGVKVIAGSDSTEKDPDPPSEVPYGISLLNELQYQHEAGMSNLDCLISATSGPADFFGINDIGVIEDGRRADFLVVDGDPLRNLKDIYKISSVWLKGRKVR